jgi:type VI secretion system protein VasG
LQQTQESLFKENSHQDDSFYSGSENEEWQADTDLTESQQVNRKQLAVIQDELLSMQGDNTCVPAQVDEAVIAAIVAEWTGIPLSQMMRDEVSAVMELAERLKKRVVE